MGLVRVQFRVQGSGFRVQGSGFRVQGSGFRVQGSGFRVQGRSGPRASDANESPAIRTRHPKPSKPLTSKPPRTQTSTPTPNIPKTPIPKIYLIPVPLGRKKDPFCLYIRKPITQKVKRIPNTDFENPKTLKPKQPYKLARCRSCLRRSAFRLTGPFLWTTRRDSVMPGV